MSDAATREVLEASQQLLRSIDKGDWNAYAALCDASLTAFEPEASGHLVAGLGFHHFYFQLPGDPKATRQSSIASPDIRVIGDCAIVCYTRLTQKVDGQGNVSVAASNETRLWKKIDGKWKHIHFHRSPC